MAIALKDRKWIVYKHTSPTNKVYIGITSNKPEIRWGVNGCGYKKQTVMWNAIQKYGWDNFKHEIIETDLSYDEAIKKEQFYIKKFKSNCKRYSNPTMGYNMDDGGKTSHPVSDETRKKISKALIKPQLIDCYDLEGNLVKIYQNIPSIIKDFPVTKDSIRNNCNRKIKSVRGFRFFYHNETQGKDKIEPYTLLIEQKRKNEKMVSQYTLEGEYVATFNTILEAAKSVKVDASHIIEVCGQKQKTCKGFQWVYGSKEKNGSSIEPYHDLYKKRRNERMVSQYTLEGEYVTTFNSVSEAAKSVKAYLRHIRAVCEHKRKTCKGFQWRYGSKEENGLSIEPYYALLEAIKNNKKIVSQYTLEGEYVNTFNTISEAAKSINVSPSDIKYTCEHKKKSCKGFQWVYGSKKENGLSIESYHNLYKKRKNEKIVSQYTLEGEYVATFNTILEAAESVNIDAINIRSACESNKKNCRNFQWRYGTKEENGLSIEPYHNSYKQRKNEKIVSQYTLEGEYVATFNSISEAAKSINARPIYIKNTCEHKQKTCKGFQWVYGSKKENGLSIEPYHDLYKKRRNERMVSQYTLEGEYVTTFNSVSEAAKSVKTYLRHIRAVCEYKRKTCKGFQWRYGSKEDNGLFIEPKEPKSKVEKNTKPTIEKVVNNEIKEKCSQKTINKITEKHSNKNIPKIDLTGQHINHLTVLRKAETEEDFIYCKSHKTKGIYWVCRCDCGKLTTVLGQRLKNGNTKSCGCIGRTEKTKKTITIKREQRDLIGLKFGLLTVKHRGNDYISPKGYRRRKWFCECECGGTTEVEESTLIRGKTLSCGCLAMNTTGKVRVKEDLTDKMFGRWKVLYQGEDKIQKNNKHEATWVCQCTCEKGTIKTIAQNSLKSGQSMSCGCLSSELASERMSKYNTSKKQENAIA